MAKISYPKPRLPVHPILSSETSSSFNVKELPMIIDHPHVEYMTSGRSAIGRALQILQNLGILRKGMSVLLPAYHCIAMIEPFIWGDLIPIFYRIKEDLTPDFEDMAMKISSETKVLLASHYFGFYQDSLKLRQFCDTHNLVFIEDCAHAFFGEIGEYTIGGYGDFAVASPWKFFSCMDGGCLISRLPLETLPIPMLLSAGTGFELKSFFNTFERAKEYGRNYPLHSILDLPLNLKEKLWHLLKPSHFSVNAPASMQGGLSFEEFWVNKHMSKFSYMILKRSNYKNNISLRRKNYLKLESALSNISEGYPLFRTLPETVVPYVFPFFVKDPKESFSYMKKVGVPILRFAEERWSDLPENTCSVSNQYSKHIFLFPCHQSLQEQELEWMIEKILEGLQFNKNNETHKEDQ